MSREPRPEGTYKLGAGERKLLYDLRHKPAREVTLEHKARSEKKQADAHRRGREAAMWIAGDSVLNGYPLDYEETSVKSDWPHTTALDQYCSFCREYGCRAPKPKEQ